MQVLWSWSSTEIDLGGTYTRKDLVLPGPISLTNTAALPSYTVTLTAKFDGAAPTDVSTIDVELWPQSSPVKANLRGPSGDVRADRTIIFNATSSADPDDPSNGREPFNIQWECTREDFPEPCFPGKAYGLQNGLTWSIDGTLLTPGKQHTFVARVSKGNRNDMAAVTIKPTAADIPTGRLVRVCGSACREKHSADMPLSLSLVADAASAGATVTWSSDQVNQMSSYNGECNCWYGLSVKGAEWCTALTGCAKCYCQGCVQLSICVQRKARL